MFFRKDAIILTWVDDCIIFSNNLSVIQNIVDLLREDFDVELEEDINGGNVSIYLGIIIERHKDNSFEIKQSDINFLGNRRKSKLKVYTSYYATPTQR